MNAQNAEWEALVRGVEDSLDTISRAFASPGTLTAESSLGDVEAGIRRGYCALHNRRAIAETLRKYGLVKKWDEIANYVLLATNPSARPQRIMNPRTGFSRRTTQFLTVLRRAACDDSIGSASTSFPT